MRHLYFFWIFIMNKIIGFLIISLLLPRVVFSEQIKININANVMERSCTVSNDTASLLVGLNPNDLNGKLVGIPFTETPFSIVLENCPKNINSAHIIFTGVNDTIMTNLLKNLDETDAGASNIAIGIYDNNKKIIDISNNKTTLKIDHNLVNNIFNFYASYIKTSNTSSAGKVLCIANFELSYD